MTNFTNADLRAADLRNIDLTHSKLTGAKYNKETKFPSGFEIPKCMVFEEDSQNTTDVVVATK